MSKTIAIFVAAAVSAVAASPYTVASAAPAGGAFAIKNAAPISVENARWVGGWRGGGWRAAAGGWRGGGWGWGVGGGLVAGAIIGGALAAPYYGGYYGGGPYVVDDGYYGGCPATTPNRAVAAAQWNTACNDSGATIQIPERIWATMAVAIRVRRKAGRKQKTPA